VASVGLRLMELPEPLKGERETSPAAGFPEAGPAFRISPWRFGRWSMSSGRIPGRADGAAGDSHHGEHGRTTECHGAVAARSDDEAAEAVFEARGMEVHQQADAKMTHA
jgi:hypothetical protein